MIFSCVDNKHNILFGTTMMHGAGASPYGGYYFIVVLDECNQAP
jgi:hypothetical protein